MEQRYLSRRRSAFGSARRWCVQFLGAVIGATILSTPEWVAAAPGDPDATFDTDGVVEADLGGDDLVFDMAVQPDGKIVVVGGMNSKFALARFNVDGSLDHGFGTGGIVIDTEDGPATSVVIQPDGKIVVAGGPNEVWKLLRYDVNGTLDPSFGGGGRVTTPWGSVIAHSWHVSRLSVTTGGKIVAAGGGYGGLIGPQLVLLAKYHDDGSLDVDFDADGMLAFGGSHGVRGLAVQDDDRIVTAFASCGFVACSPIVSRHLADGNGDLTFNDGSTSGAFGNQHDIPADLILQGSRVLIDGGSPQGFAVLRFRSNGLLDSTFGEGGLATSSLLLNGGAMTLDSLGRIYAISGDGSDDFAVLRLTDRGSVDASFGDQGAARPSLAGTAKAIVITPSGRVVVAGEVQNTTVDWALVGLEGGTDPLCGNGVVESAEGCDLGVANCGMGVLCASGCSADCEVIGSCTDSQDACISAADCPPGEGCCGDTEIDAVEQCDDGNVADGDCCSSSCQIEAPPCVPLPGGCASALGPHLVSSTIVRKTVLSESRSSLGGLDTWKTLGQITIGDGQTVDPDTEVVAYALNQNDGSNQSTSLYSPVLVPSACSSGQCFVPTTSTTGMDTRWRFKLRGSNPDVSGAPGWRAGTLSRKEAAADLIKFALKGDPASIVTPANVDGVRRVRQSIRIGDDCITTILDCAPDTALTRFTCSQAQCGNGVVDRGERCGEPSLAGCAAGTVCDTCRCVPQ